MLNPFKSVASLCFKQNETQSKQAATSLPTQKTHKNKIKDVVIDSFLAFLGQERNRLPPRHLKTIQSRITSKLMSEQHYPIPCQSQTPTKEDILNWFIQGKHGTKLYRRAVVKQDREVEAFLRNQHVDISHPDEKTGDTPLILAARAHDADQVELLLNSGAAVDTRNKKGMDAINEAVSNLNCVSYQNDRQFYTIKHLLNNGADVNQPLLMTSPQKTLSESAIAKAELRIVQLLINHTRELHPCMLFELISDHHENNPEIISHLLKSFTFDMAVRNQGGLTPLMVATCQQRPKIIKALLDCPNNALEAQLIKPIEGNFLKYWTAYSLANHHQFKECSELLLAHGAKKIIPKHTESEAKWMMKYNELKKRKAESEDILDDPVIKLSGPVGMAMNLCSYSHYRGLFKRLEAERPEQHLPTPPEN